MRFSFALVALALCTCVYARDLPTTSSSSASIEDTHRVGGFGAPVEMQLSAAFLASAGDAAPAPGVAHKLPYSNPFTGMCQPTEMKVSITGIPGSFCSPKCSATAPCPADTHKGATAKGECVLETPGSASPTQCALICAPTAAAAAAASSGCPAGATCIPIQGLGICTYTAKDENEAVAATTATMEIQN